MKAVTPLVLAFACLTAPCIAHAENVAIRFEGIVTGVSENGGYLSGRVQKGDRVTGTYAYNTSTADADPSPVLGVYRHLLPQHGIRVVVNGLSFRTQPKPTGSVFLTTVQDGKPGGPYFEDDFAFHSFENAMDIDVPGGDSHISLLLRKFSGTQYSGDAIPAGVPVLSQWDVKAVQVNSINAQGEFFSIALDLTSVAPCTTKDCIPTGAQH